MGVNLHPLIKGYGLTGCESGKKRAHKLKKVAGTPAGCPSDTWQDKQGSTGRCPRESLLFSVQKLTEKGISARTPAWCPGTAGQPGGFQKSYVIFYYVPFLLPAQWSDRGKSLPRGKIASDLSPQ